MGEQPAGDTRTRILAVAVELFASHGYQHTSVRQIADSLAISKAAVLYHFPSKDHILAAVAEPLIADLEAALRQAESVEPERMRWAALEGWLDAMLRHRRWLQMIMHDVALLAREPGTYHRMMHVARRIGEIVAGPDAGLAGQVRAVQARAMLGDPVVYLTDVPAAELRAEILAGVRRLLGEPEPEPARPARRRAGRPPALSAEKLALARRMYAEGGHTADEIAAAVGVSRATLYRHVGSPRRPTGT